MAGCVKDKQYVNITHARMSTEDGDGHQDFHQREARARAAPCTRQRQARRLFPRKGGGRSAGAWPRLFGEHALQVVPGYSLKSVQVGHENRS